MFHIHISPGGGDIAPKRAGESIAKGLESEHGLTYSLKEYEELVYRTMSTERNGAERKGENVPDIPLNYTSVRAHFLVP